MPGPIHMLKKKCFFCQMFGKKNVPIIVSTAKNTIKTTCHSDVFQCFRQDANVGQGFILGEIGGGVHDDICETFHVNVRG